MGAQEILFSQGKRLLVACAVFILVLGVAGYWAFSHVYQTGYVAGSDKVTAEWHKERKELQAQLNQLTQQVADLQRDLDRQSTEFERRSHEEKQALTIDYERRLAAVSARVERVYIPAKPDPALCKRTDDSTTGTSSGIREERCELDPAVVADLASIAHDGDFAIIERNELIDRYNAARAALIKQKQLETTP